MAAPGHRRDWALLGSAMFLLIAPGTVDVLIPWWITRWRASGDTRLTAVGVVLIAGGAIVLMESFLRFALRGLGTPAPVFPTKHLVVTGYYRYVRNPMYVANVAVILGQAIWFASVPLVMYCVLVWLSFHVFVMIYEEPTLRATFGAEYDAFCQRVPRWIPRVTPSVSE